MRFLVNRHTVLVLGLLLLFVLIQCQGIIVSNTANAAQIVEHLWGISQDCHFPIENETDSLDGYTRGFDDLTATCRGVFTQGKQEKYWAYTEFEDTSLPDFSTVSLEVRFSFDGWLDDVFMLQISHDDGDSWSTLDIFDETHPPTDQLTTQEYALTDRLTTTQLLNATQIRILGVQGVGSPDSVALNLDAARLVVSGEASEEEKKPTPTSNVEEPSPRPTRSPSVVPTTSPTPTQSPQGMNRRTPTATATGASDSPTMTPTGVFTATIAATSTPLPTSTPELDPTETLVNKKSITPTAGPTDLLSASPTVSNTPIPPPVTPTPSETQSATLTSSPQAVATFTPTTTPTQALEKTEARPSVPHPDGPDTPFDLDSGSPHGGFSAFTDGCAGCHRSHTNQGPHLQVAWPEEQTCFGCHSGDGGAGTDIETAFISQPNTGSAFYSHPVGLTVGVHELSASEIGSSYFSEENRHVECVDCHDPHDSGNEEYFPPALQDQVRNAAGVVPLYNGQGALGDFVWLGTAQYEYQLCFKCHSSFVALPTYLPAGWNGLDTVYDGLAKLTNVEPEQVLDNRDLALEFNPSSASYHPVMASGKNTNIPAESFVPGWSISSWVYCSDCHSNPYAATQGSGPHGPTLHILNEESSYITVDEGASPVYTGQEVCFNCHRFETYVNSSSREENTNFRRSNRNLHHAHSDDVSCYICHDSHGSEQLHLINLDASIDKDQEDRLVFFGGYDGQPTNSQTFWQISPDGSEKTCFISCHNHNHTMPGKKYPNYSLDMP